MHAAFPSAILSDHKIPSVRTKGLSRLLLSARSVGSPGRFSGVTQVQRLHTAGGVAPKGSCTPGASAPLRVPYSADYVLFTA